MGGRAIRELNPVRAGMVTKAELYPWSSAAVHCGLVQPPHAGFGGLMASDRPFPGKIGEERWATWLAQGLDEVTTERIRSNTATGRPCGGEEFLTWMETQLDRILRPRKVGRKPKSPDGADLTDDFLDGI